MENRERFGPPVPHNAAIVRPAHTADRLGKKKKKKGEREREEKKHTMVFSQYQCLILPIRTGLRPVAE